MKNIKYIILLILCVGLFSCSGDDTFTRAYVDNEVKTELVGTLSVNTVAAAAGTMVSFDYTLPQSFDVESTLEVTATSTYSAFEFDPNTTTTYITIPAGTTSGTDLFEMPGSHDDTGGFYGISEHATVSLTGIALTQPETDKIDDPYTLSSESTTINSLDFHDGYMLANTNTLLVSLDWLGPWDLNDFDLYIFDDPFTAIYESAETGSRFEGDYFNNPGNEEHPDGDYIVEIAIWTVDGTDPVPWRLVFTRDDGSQEIFEGTVDPAVGFIDPIKITQVTDGDGNRTYTLTEL